MLHWLLWPLEDLWDIIYELNKLERKHSKHHFLSPPPLYFLASPCCGGMSPVNEYLGSKPFIRAPN